MGAETNRSKVALDRSMGRTTTLMDELRKKTAREMMDVRDWGGSTSLPMEKAIYRKAGIKRPMMMTGALR